MSGSDIESSATAAIHRRSGCHSGIVYRCCWATVETRTYGGGGGGAFCDWVAGDATVGRCAGESDHSGEDGERKCEIHGCGEILDA